MKIVDLCEFYSERGGGVRSYLDKMLKAAHGTEHEVIVVAPGPEDSVITEGQGTIRRFAAPPMPYDPTYRMPWRLDRMRSIVKELKPDVLQVSSPFAPAWVAATISDVPLKTYVYHSDPIGCYVTRAARWVRLAPVSDLMHGVSWGYLRRICNSFDATLVAGKWLAELLLSKGCERVHTVPFGIDHADFGPERRDAVLRERLLGPFASRPGAQLALIGGRLASDKRQSLLLSAMKLVNEKRPVAVVLLGDGPERERLEAMGRTLPAFSSLLFTKNRAEYAALLASVDVVLQGSMCETFGFFPSEALASGVPLVVPDQGGAAFLGDPSCVVQYPSFGGASAVAAAIENILQRPRKDLQLGAIQAAHAIPESREHYQNLFRFYEEQLLQVASKKS
ncbi:MAG: glycosyltransferase [Polyangiaceae bacterium]|nr:glycosyltransferase [Polyangiaceae bacterium]